MPSSTRFRAILAAFLTFTMVPATSVVHAQSAATATRVNLTGLWIDPAGRIVQIVETGNSLLVRYLSGRGPFRGTRRGIAALRVRFIDDHNCCTGDVVDADTIHWSNGGQWRRTIPVFPR